MSKSGTDATGQRYWDTHVRGYQLSLHVARDVLEVGAGTRVVVTVALAKPGSAAGCR